MSNVLLAKNFIAETAIPAYRIARMGSTDDAVRVTTGWSDAVIGVTTDIGAAIGERCDINLVGIAYIEAAAAITRGSWLASDGVGRASVALPAAGVNCQVVGRALEAASAAGDVIRVLLAIGQIQG